MPQRITSVGLSGQYFGFFLQNAIRDFRSLPPLTNLTLGATLPNKSLRILIADKQHFNRMKIERLFNQLGYFRVAPVHSLEELLNLVEYGCEPFDLLVINASMADGKLNLLDFCLDNRQVARALIFDGQCAQLPAIAASERHKVLVSHAMLPDLATIQRLMAHIDRSLPLVATVISVR